MKLRTYFVIQGYEEEKKYLPPNDASADFWLEVITIVRIAGYGKPESMTGATPWSHLLVHMEDDYDTLVEMDVPHEWIYWVMQTYGWSCDETEFHSQNGHEYLTQFVQDEVTGKVADNLYEVLDLSDVGNPGKKVWEGTWQECQDWIDADNEGQGNDE